MYSQRNCGNHSYQGDEAKANGNLSQCELDLFYTMLKISDVRARLQPGNSKNGLHNT